MHGVHLQLFCTFCMFRPRFVVCAMILHPMHAGSQPCTPMHAHAQVGVNGLKALHAIDPQMLEGLLATAIKLKGSGKATNDCLPFQARRKADSPDWFVQPLGSVDQTSPAAAHWWARLPRLQTGASRLSCQGVLWATAYPSFLLDPRLPVCMALSCSS